MRKIIWKQGDLEWTQEIEVPWLKQCKWINDEEHVGNFLKCYLPFTENSMKGVTFSYRLKGILVKYVEDTMIWNERKKLK